MEGPGCNQVKCETSVINFRELWSLGSIGPIIIYCLYVGQDFLKNQKERENMFRRSFLLSGLRSQGAQVVGKKSIFGNKSTCAHLTCSLLFCVLWRMLRAGCVSGTALTRGLEQSDRRGTSVFTLKCSGQNKTATR